MIIVSQDKETILNFERINFIRIEDMYQIVASYADDYYEHLGAYKSEKRAKEVLKEITRYYRMYQGIKYCDDKVKIGILQEIDKTGQDAYIYTMPED